MSVAPTTHAPVQSSVVIAHTSAGTFVSAAQRVNIQKLVNDLKKIQANSGVTTDQIDALKTDLAAVAQVATKPSKELVKTLMTDLKAASADKSISTLEQLQLAADVQAVLVSANVPLDLALAVVVDTQAIVTASNVTTADVKLITADLKAIVNTFRAAHPGHA
jgi:hypothetical protein